MVPHGISVKSSVIFLSNLCYKNPYLYVRLPLMTRSRIFGFHLSVVVYVDRGAELIFLVLTAALEVASA
jgi:hypothetical protein